MHVFSTNIVLWLRTLVKETIDALEEAEENMKGGHLEGKLKLVGSSNPALIFFIKISFYQLARSAKIF